MKEFDFTFFKQFEGIGVDETLEELGSEGLVVRIFFFEVLAEFAEGFEERFIVRGELFL